MNEQTDGWKNGQGHSYASLQPVGRAVLTVAKILATNFGFVPDCLDFLACLVWSDSFLFTDSLKSFS